MTFILNNQHSLILLSKYKGCIVGELCGDCLGKNFEGQHNIHVQHIVENWTNSYQLTYSDDTSFTFSVASVLIEYCGIDLLFLAKNLYITFKNEPNRGYGNNIGVVLNEINNLTSLEDFAMPSIYEPAKSQFKGMGSFGNGGAMRVAPISLFYHKCDVDTLIKAATECTLLTHYNAMALIGALLQALAIRQALVIQHPPEYDETDDNIRHSSFLNGQKLALATLDNIKSELENLNQSLLLAKLTIGHQDAIVEYSKKLGKIKEYLENEQTTDEDIIKHLGNGVAAFKSVPTSLYLFLKAIINAYKPQTDLGLLKEISLPMHHEISSNLHLKNNFFTDALCHAVKLGGDTDTIGSMTGSLIGAWIGIDHPAFPEYWKNPKYKKFEGLQKALTLAEKLYATINVPGTTHQDESFM